MNPFLQAAQIARQLPHAPGWAIDWQDAQGLHKSVGQGGHEWLEWANRNLPAPEWVRVRPVSSGLWRTFHSGSRPGADRARPKR